MKAIGKNEVTFVPNEEETKNIWRTIDALQKIVNYFESKKIYSNVKLYDMGDPYDQYFQGMSKGLVEDTRSMLICLASANLGYFAEEKDDEIEL